jgi:hypothetical protein
MQSTVVDFFLPCTYSRLTIRRRRHRQRPDPPIRHLTDWMDGCQQHPDYPIREYTNAQENKLVARSAKRRNVAF